MKIHCKSEFRDLLIAETAQYQADAFEETELGFQTSFTDSSEANKVLEYLKLHYDNLLLSFDILKVPKENWNAIWEESFSPVFLEKNWVIRASFHKIKDGLNEVIIDPKMSFGTGHHPTTLILANWLINNFEKGQKVLDMGCGTGVLTIISEKLGASQCIGIDNDKWAVENSLENSDINKTKVCDFKLGDKEYLSKLNDSFDLIIANINKNILIDQLDEYKRLLIKNGVLITSGYFYEDEKDLIASAHSLGLNFSSSLTKENWTATVFTT